MIQELKFVKINTDVNNHDINPEAGEYRMMENLVPAQRGRGVGFVRESLKGTIETQIDDPEYPINPADRKVIGSYEHKPSGKIYFFVYTGDFNRIMEYDSKTQTSKRIIRSTSLPWTEDTRIVGVGLLDDTLYWTDPNLSYFKIQDDNQYAEIDYNVKGETLAFNSTYLFVVDIPGVPGGVNFSLVIPGPVTATDAAIQVANAMNADVNFTAHFTATLSTDATVIKIKAISTTGRLDMTSNNIGAKYNYFQTNFDPLPETEEDWRLYPVPPKKAPSVIPFISTAISGNAIIGRNYQFAFRQIYDNNQITVLSPFSEVVASGKYPENIDDPTAFNAISILYLVTRPDRTKEVEILARTPDTGEWFVVKTIKRSEFFGSGGFYQYTFTGTEQQVPVATADAIKQQEGIPRESIDLQIQKNKLFAIDSLTGFDYGDNDMTLSLTVMEKTAVERERYFKDGGLYNFGVRFFDEEMRTDGTVHKVTQVPIPETGAISFVPPNGGKLETRRQYLEVDLKGKPPVWAHYWTLVRSDELYYSQFIQCYAYVNYYRRPEVEGDPKTTDSSNYYMYGNKYGFRADISSYADYRYIHLQLPTNIPFAAERGMMVKYLTDTTVGQSTRVLDVQGPMIVVEQPTGLTGGKFTFDTVFVEIYIPKNVTETNSFYEVGGLRDVGNPGEEDRNFGTNLPYDVFGDVHSVLNDDEGLNWKYDFNEYITNGSDEDDQGIVKSKYTYGRFESYSPSFSPTQLTDVQGEQTVAFLLEFEYDFDFGYIIDQSYASRNLGRPAPLLQNVREETRPSTIRWSNDYVANASINGLHTFEPLNEYPLPLERGPIVKLQRAGEDVMLAIHSSAVTSLYIGKGVIRSADLNPTLVTTTDVVGSDNELKYSHGTVHPTSVCEVDGDVYFWDGIRNEPVRYSQNGLTPIATTFGARVFFKDTIRATFGNTDEYECYSQYDRLLNMVFFTFKSDTESMTIGFHESTKAWIGKYGFVPEYYGVIGDQFIGFYQGIPWLHNADDLNHNTFYGVLYPSKAHLVINNGGHIEKSWDGIMVDSNKIWELPAIYNNENQLTSLVANDFVWRDQVYYADFLRDENTDPLLLKSGQIALRHGKIMTSQILEVEMELNSSEPHYLHSIVVASTLKAGHMLQQQQ